MLQPHVALIVLILYLLLLFGVAQFADRQKRLGRSIVANPYVYALSLCVYVSAWTFYGSIGRAATTGLEFLPIYLGPTLAMIVGWIIIRKMIRVSQEFRLTSISDFISFRYGRSYALGAVVVVLSLLMVTPYVALQLIAISSSMEILSGTHIFLGVPVESKLVVALLLGAFAVIFGARHLDPMERHEGLVAVIAFESLVKLVAFLAVGLYVAYGLFGGYGNILSEMSGLAAINERFAELVDVEYTLWFSLTLISFFAVLFLPRQFHVMVVENSDEKHIKKAMWLFPIYLLLMNLFVPAIAWGGLLLRTPGPEDAFVITIPYFQGQEMLALFVFIGGASAATAMILVESVAVGTMMLNDLEMPYLLSRIPRGTNLPRLLLNTRRLNILLVVLLGYLYSLAAAYQILAEIGIVSFLAVSQIAPAALGGLYWKRGNRHGAFAGLIAGFLLWIYTALIPTITVENSFMSGLVRNGPFGIAFLKPTSLFGLDLDVWTNSVFWTLLVNCSLYVLISLATRPSPEEAAIADGFVDIYQEKAKPRAIDKGSIRLGTVEELEVTLARYIGEERAGQLVDANLARLGTTRETIEAKQLLELWDQFEKILTGSVGPSATRMIVEDQVPVKPVLEAEETTLPEYVIEVGKVYVVSGEAYEVFTDQITHGVEGLCITHFEPDEVRRKWGFTETPIIKLSDVKEKDRYISPKNLPLLFITIKSFIESSRNSIVLIDSIEQIVNENASVTPEKEIVDFIHQIERLGLKTRIILSDRPQFVHKELKAGINEVRGLLFDLGPLSAYLFSVFSEAMLATLSETQRNDAVMEANALIKAKSFFEEIKDQPSGKSSEASSEAEMRVAISSASLVIDSDLVLTRRGFFVAIRRLARIIKKHDPAFDLMASVGALLKSYGMSPFELSLVPGTTYVLDEEKPNRSLEIFSELMSHGMDGLCISRYNPEILNEKYGILVPSVIWLTQKSEPGYRTVDPTNFPRLSSMISDFLENASYPLVLLEGLGYLITQSNYETVLRFIQSQRDEIALKNSTMLVHIDPLALDVKELHRLVSELEPLKI